MNQMIRVDYTPIVWCKERVTEFPLITIVGFLIEDGPNHLVIASSTDGETYSNYTYIPITCVKSSQYLNIKKEFTL